MLKIMISGDDTAKSTALAHELVSRAVDDINKKYILIVPEQFSLQTQKTIVNQHPHKACLNIDIISFDRLAHIVLAKLGRDDLRILDDTGKALVLRNVLANIRQNLLVYKNKTHLPGFVEEVKSMITEFKQYGVDDNRLFLMQESAQEYNDRLLFSKLQDLRLILRSFDSEIRNKYTTSEELLDVLARVLPESDFLRGADVYLDGFTGFTPVQYKVIKQMLKCADNVICTCLLPPQLAKRQVAEYELFHLSADTFVRLKEAAEDTGTECSVEAVETTHKPAIKAFTMEAPTCDAEVEAAAGQILRLIMEEGYRYRDIAVLTSDMELYHPVIEKVFAQSKIPVFIDHNSGIPGNILVRFILAALAMDQENMSYDSVFSLIKTGLTDLSSEEISMLENYCLEFNIRGRSRWNKDFAANRKLYGADALFWDLDMINELRKRLMGQLGSFIVTDIRKAETVSDKVSAIRALLEKCLVEEKLELMADALDADGLNELAGQYRRIYRLIDELLDKINMLLGENKMQTAEFADLFTSGADEIKVGIIPPALDMVTAGDLMRTRLAEVKHVFVLGANEGKMPLSGSSAGIFTQRERELLKGTCELAPTVREDELTARFYIYQCFRKPEDSLYVSWARMNGKAEEMQKSWVAEDLLHEAWPEGVKHLEYKEAVMWKEQASRKLAEDMRSFAEANHRFLIEKIMQDKDADALIAALHFETDEEALAFLAAKDPDRIRQMIDAALYSNRQTSLDEQTALELYGGKLKGSVSRFERFYECPYKHFLSYGLRLEKRPEYELKVTDLGTIYHEALERYSGKLEENNTSFRDIEDAESIRLVKESVDEAIESLGSDIFEASARNEFLKKRMVQITSKTTDVLRDQVKAGKFDPDEFEMEFQEDISEDIRFSGKIDRVDIYDSNDLFVKIIDYKSGSKQFSISDIYSGLQLQLVAYLDQAIKKKKQENPGKAVKPAGVYYYLIKDNYEEAGKHSPSEHMLSGLTSTEDGVFEAIDGALKTGKQSNIISVKKNSDGALSKSSKVAGNGELFEMMSFVNKRIVQAGEQIRKGNVDIEPYKKGAKNGCNYCDFKEICRFDAGHFGTGWKEVSDISENDMEAEIYGRKGE